MSDSNKVSIPALMSTLLAIVIWVALILGIIVTLMIGVGLFAFLNGGQITSPGGAVYSENVSEGRLIAALLGIVTILPFLVYICVSLRQILNTLAEGDPFLPENAPRLTRIAITVAIMELARNFVGFIVTATKLVGIEEPFHFSINVSAWVAVAVLVVLSQVFREGARLREEEKMTI